MILSNMLSVPVSVFVIQMTTKVEGLILGLVGMSQLFKWTLWASRIASYG